MFERRQAATKVDLSIRKGTMETIVKDIREFVIGNFLFGQGGDTLANDQSFLESGIIDSTGVLELVAFLEQPFQISVADRELLPENLDSVQNASQFVMRKVEAKEHVAR